LENARVVGVVAQRQAIRREGYVVVALAFEGERPVEIVEALGVDIVGARAAEQEAPETHAPKIACGLATVQCSFTPHARPATEAPPTPPPPPAPGPPPPPPGPPPPPRSGLAVFWCNVPGVGAHNLPVPRPRPRAPIRPA